MSLSCSWSHEQRHCTLKEHLGKGSGDILPDFQGFGSFVQYQQKLAIDIVVYSKLTLCGGTNENQGVVNLVILS